MKIIMDRRGEDRYAHARKLVKEQRKEADRRGLPIGHASGRLVLHCTDCGQYYLAENHYDEHLWCPGSPPPKEQEFGFGGNNE